MTKLEELVFSHPEYQALGDEASRGDRQKVLDEITVEILGQLSAQDITSHVREVYDDTVKEYAVTPHNLGIVDELVRFMELVPDKGRVLDVGCGVGRDVLFMSIPDTNYREENMSRVTDGKTTLERLPVPTTTFHVVGIDNSQGMIAEARSRVHEALQGGLLPPYGPRPLMVLGDMHDIALRRAISFDGIWSCTALFTHTPRELLQPAMESVAKALNRGGVFAATYTNGRADGRYDKLLPSSTGRIKYFSQPDPDEIAELAKACSLILESESFSDYRMGDRVVESLFVAQFFRKV